MIASTTINSMRVNPRPDEGGRGLACAKDAISFFRAELKEREKNDIGDMNIQ